jgi:hypothetical protein
MWMWWYRTCWKVVPDNDWPVELELVISKKQTPGIEWRELNYRRRFKIIGACYILWRGTPDLDNGSCWMMKLMIIGKISMRKRIKRYGVSHPSMSFSTIIGGIKRLVNPVSFNLFLSFFISSIIGRLFSLHWIN